MVGNKTEDLRDDQPDFEVIDTCRLLFVTGRDKLTYYNKLKTLIPKEQWKSFWI